MAVASYGGCHCTIVEVDPLKWASEIPKQANILRRTGYGEVGDLMPVSVDVAEELMTLGIADHRHRVAIEVDVWAKRKVDPVVWDPAINLAREIRPIAAIEYDVWVRGCPTAAMERRGNRSAVPWRAYGRGIRIGHRGRAIVIGIVSGRSDARRQHDAGQERTIVERIAGDLGLDGDSDVAQRGWDVEPAFVTSRSHSGIYGTCRARGCFCNGFRTEDYAERPFPGGVALFHVDSNERQGDIGERTQAFESAAANWCHLTANDYFSYRREAFESVFAYGSALRRNDELAGCLAVEFRYARASTESIWSDGCYWIGKANQGNAYASFEGLRAYRDNARWQSRLAARAAVYHRERRAAFESRIPYCLQSARQNDFCDSSHAG